MQELRLAPAAATVWAAALAVLLVAPWAGVAVVAAAVAAVLAARQVGQALLTGGMGAAAVVTAWMRVHAAAAWDAGGQFRGTVSGAPRELDGGGHLVRVLTPGHPGPIAVFTRDLPPGVVPGCVVEVAGRAGESAQPGTARVTVSGALEVLEGPRGLAALAQHVRRTFSEAVSAHVGGGARGLIPGMVLGDTSLQTGREEQAYVDTGLSHLSAVSGSNVAIVTTAAVLAAGALGLGLRGRIAVAGTALLTFAALVGPEPSVLRASVTGLVALAAVLSSSVAEPLHTLCLAVAGLILVDTNLAVSYGFALSVAATAGIVVLSPFIHRALAPLRWPDILTRAVAVAVAADMVTMPLVALMTGRVSLVAVAANVLAAPVAAPITVLGLVAVLLSLAPGGLEVPVLWVVEPLAWWVHAVAEHGARWPGATVETGPATVLVAYGWVLAGFLAGRPRMTLAVALAVVAGGGAGDPTSIRPADPAGMNAHVVGSEATVEPVPSGTEVVVVLETGRPHRRPVVTREGIPVVYPNRDGPVRTGAAR
ncbi:ComEC/Rec2 family competence protein [Corynebacterium sp. UBA2622]|uniref:ComEC/Rec2 family competence protein n=1 Tax=Corynebacterium sp. UBA2622 TaxID=1946393 RepID=UPI0025C1F189|nr:ComEC/Rec2 family competence protein [Corynebacterium sp. UBA2622]